MKPFRRCYATVCPDTVMSRYSSSISKVDCPATVWAKITGEATPVGDGAGGSGPAPTGGSGQPGSTRNAGSGDYVVPVAGGLAAWLIGVVAVLL